MATDEQVKLIIKAVTDQAVRELDKFNKTLTAGEKKQGKFSKAMKSAKKNWKALAATGLTAGIAIKQGLDLAKEFTKFEQGAQAMENQFGVSSDAVIAKLKEVSGGTVSSADIVLSANRTMALGVTKDLDKMGKLLEFARLRGRAMGIDTTTAFSDLTTGIGRQSPLILDNLGLITKGWNKEAAAAGVAFDSQFVLNKVLEQASAELKKVGKLQETSAEKVQRASATWDDMQLVIGEILLPILVDVMDVFITIGNWMLKDAPIAWEKFKQGFVIAWKVIKLVATQTIKAMQDPFLAWINLAIRGLNLLRDKQIDQLKGITFSTVEEARTQLQVEQVKYDEIGKASEKAKAVIIKGQKDAAEGAKEGLDESTKTWQQWATNIMGTVSGMTSQISAISSQYFKNKNLELDNALAKELKANEARGLSEEELAKLNEETNEKFAKKKRKLARQEAKATKKIRTLETTMATAQAVMTAYAQLGPIGGAIAGGLIATLGATQIALIQKQPLPAAQEGGIIRGAPGSAGRVIRAGEQGRDEAIIPLEDPEAQSKLGGLGGTTIVLNVETLIGDDMLPGRVTDMIDKALFQRKQDGLSRL